MQSQIQKLILEKHNCVLLNEDYMLPKGISHVTRSQIPNNYFRKKITKSRDLLLTSTVKLNHAINFLQEKNLIFVCL